MIVVVGYLEKNSIMLKVVFPKSWYFCSYLYVLTGRGCMKKILNKVVCCLCVGVGQIIQRGARVESMWLLNYALGKQF